jgi:hypothetical protein
MIIDSIMVVRPTSLAKGPSGLMRSSRCGDDGGAGGVEDGGDPVVGAGDGGWGDVGVVGRSGGIAGSKSGEAGSMVGKPGVFGGGESNGGVGCEKGEGWKAADGGGEGVEHRIGGGEMDISLFSSQSRRSSASFLRFLSFFRGGGALSGDCTGIACCGIGPSAGAAVGDVARSGTPGAAVAALPRPRWRRWRRFPAAAVNSAGAGKVERKLLLPLL